MANKTVDQLTTFSGSTADNDLLPIYDASESSDEKLKNISIEDLKTNLNFPSMDPTALGNWVQIKSNSGSGNIAFSCSDLEADEVYKAVMEWETDGTNSAENCSIHGDFNGDWQNTSRYITNGNSGSSGRVLQDNVYKEAKVTMEVTIWPGKRMARTILSVVDDSDTVDNRRITQYYNYSIDITSFSWNLWGSGAKTGTYKNNFYIWQEVKPIELHSYELVKEYNLDNESLSDTFDYDGEADPECIIISSLKGANVNITFNGDTGTNYLYGGFSQDGTALSASSFTGQSSITIGSAQTGRSSFQRCHAYLKQDGNPRLFSRFDSNYDTANTDRLMGSWTYGWSNTADAVTSITMDTNSNNITGNIRVYKLAKTHLFNQTIYNDLTLNVTTTGSDTTGDGTTQKPFATIQGAFDWLRNKTINVDASVVIQLSDGTYNNQTVATWQHTSKNVTVRGNPSNPAAVTLNFAAYESGIACDGAFLSVTGLKLVGNDKSEWRTGFFCQQNGFLRISDCIATDFGVGAQAYGCAHIRVLGSASDMTANHYGVSASLLSTATVESGSITNNVSVGIVGDQGARAHYLSAVTLSGNGANTANYNAGTVTNG